MPVPDGYYMAWQDLIFLLRSRMASDIGTNMVDVEDVRHIAKTHNVEAP